MGCGYSKINSKKRRRLKDDNLDVCSNDSLDQDQSPEFGSEKYRRLETSPGTLKKNGLVNLTEDSLASRRRIANKIKPISGPMRPPINRSASQLSFFRMLDEKIANGKDLDEETTTEDDTEELLRSDTSGHILPSSTTDNVIEMGESEEVVTLDKCQSSVVVSSCPSRPNTANGNLKSSTRQSEFGENYDKVLSQDNVIKNGTELMSNGQVAS